MGDIQVVQEFDTLSTCSVLSGPGVGHICETYFDDLAKEVQQGHYSPLQMVRINDISEAGHYEEGLLRA